MSHSIVAAVPAASGADPVAADVDAVVAVAATTAAATVVVAAADLAPDPDTTPHSASAPGLRARSSARRAEMPAGEVSVLGMRTKLIVSGPRDARIGAIAGHQRGRVSRRQLLEAGLSTGQIHRLTAIDWLLREHAGVYAVGYRSMVPLGRETAALLAARDGAVLSHASAAAVWGIDAVTPDPDVVELLVDTGVATRRAGIRAHRTGKLVPADRRVRQDLPVTAPARMLLDLAAQLDERLLERAFDQALVLGVVTERQIADVVDRAGGHRGRRALTELATDHLYTTVTRSEAEERLLELLRTAGLPEPRVNAQLHGLEVDFWWPEAALVVEVDGYRFHSTRAAFERDRLRDARLAMAGIEVLRVTWRRMERERFAVLVEIATALARRTPPGAIDTWAPLGG
jgi:very-short-patch-repair endonuclease